MAMSAARSGNPLSELNTTPLIDVLLVLLVMFIITIPVATHAVTVTLATACDGCPIVNNVKNKIMVDANGTLRWNGRAVSEAQLRTLLAQSMALPVEPELQFEPSANASYAQSVRVINLVQNAGVTKFGFVGNERYQAFDAS